MENNLDNDDFRGEFCGQGLNPLITYSKNEFNKLIEIPKSTLNDVNILRKMLSIKMQNSKTKDLCPLILINLSKD